MRLSSCLAVLAAGIASLVGSAAAAEPLDTLVRERLLTLPPDLPRSKAYPDGAVVSGDLFKNGGRSAIAVATAGGKLVGLACFVHRDGDWREITRQALEGDLSSSDEIPFTFADLDGDGKMELLVTE